MLQAAGLAGVWHHSRAHDFFAAGNWEPDELGVRLLDFLVTVFVKDAAGGIRIRAASDTAAASDVRARARRGDGTVRCWGFGGDGRLGYGALPLPA